MLSFSKKIFSIILLVTFAGLATGCQSSGGQSNLPPDVMRYTALQKAEQDYLEMAKAGKFGYPQNGTWDNDRALATLTKLQAKYRAQGYR